MKKGQFILNYLLKGILAGVAISLGGWLYIKTREATDSLILPAFLFPIGLILICNFNFFLYTGKICYLADQCFLKKGPNYMLQLILGLVGNYIGALIMGLILGSIFNVPAFVSKMVDTKLSYEWYKLLILAIFCGMLIYFAVEAFQKLDNALGKYLVLILCIAGFIICGFEHCIADMFYFTIARRFEAFVFGDILIIIVGNSIGGLIIPLLKRLFHD